MFEDITVYIKKTKEERQKHLDFTEPCIEIGGDSKDFRGLLAHYLRTTMKIKSKVCLCHACNNDKCSNVKHLYWGTYKENLDDAIDSGRRLKYYPLNEKSRIKQSVSLKKTWVKRKQKRE